MLSKVGKVGKVSSLGEESAKGPAPRARTVAPVLGLLLAAHPAPAGAVTALSTALAAASGRDLRGCLLVALAVLAGQLSVGWSNDCIDLRRDLDAERRDKPLASGTVRAHVVATAAGGALALCVPLSLASGVLAGSAHLIGVAAAWTYNLGVKATLFSWLPYAIGFGLLPAFVVLGLPGHPWPPLWLVAAGALLGVGAHVTNVLPDIDTDLAAGIRGLPQRLGRKRSGVAAAVALLGASSVLFLGPPGPQGLTGRLGLAVTAALALAVALPAALPTVGNPRSRLPFLATLGLAGVDATLLVLRGSHLA
ncbi:4-hydroxybenzoate polyprenyltransferase [Streptacidiphilus sp. MAP12-20]|uniref:UbiA family prenyltransferase n=1 Tax=Streptacidiphilus sp. MAP12-20 TaxID=3156299 RepID=UPI00351290F3